MRLRSAFAEHCRGSSMSNPNRPPGEKNHVGVGRSRARVRAVKLSSELGAGCVR